MKMSNYFKDKLDEGDYAAVSQGKLHDGHLVAVQLFKQLKRNGQDLISEASSICRTHRVNIVTLLGVFFRRGQRARIYEFMSEGSIKKFIAAVNCIFSMDLHTA